MGLKNPKPDSALSLVAPDFAGPIEAFADANGVPIIPRTPPPSDGEQVILCAHIPIETPLPGQRLRWSQQKRKRALICQICDEPMLRIGRNKSQCKNCTLIYTDAEYAELVAFLAEAHGNQMEISICGAAVGQPGGARRLAAMLESGDLRRSDVKDGFMWEVMDAVMFLLPSLVGDEPPAPELLFQRVKSRGVLPIGGSDWFEWMVSVGVNGKVSIEERARQLREVRRGKSKMKSRE